MTASVGVGEAVGNGLGEGPAVGRGLGARPLVGAGAAVAAGRVAGEVVGGLEFSTEGVVADGVPTAEATTGVVGVGEAGEAAGAGGPHEESSVAAVAKASSTHAAMRRFFQMDVSVKTSVWAKSAGAIVGIRIPCG